MTIRCPSCNAVVDERDRRSAGALRCEKCGMRFPVPATANAAPVTPSRDADPELGIHPALAKRYRAQGTPPLGIPQHSNPPPAEGRGAVVEQRAPVVDKNAGPLPPEMNVSEPEQKAPTIELSPSLVEQGAKKVAAAAAQKVVEREERTRALGPTKARRGDDGEREKPEPLPEIPGYVLLGVVGKGAMGRVYRARAERTGALVAVKTLAPELAARPDFIARFEREAAALKAVDHPGVVSIYDRGSTGDIHYLCMPFVEGESLRRGLGGGPLLPLRALGFARQIVQALAAAHDKKVIHRDLKPENILVTHRRDKDGVEREALVLVDFGLAGMGEDDPHPNLTKSRMTMGTVNYMAPEQRTDAKRVGPQADVYAAGVILYELLTGDLPLGRFKMPTEKPGLAHLPPAIDECLARALDRDPERRYASAQDFDRDLARIEAELFAQVSRDTVVGRAVSGARPVESGPPTEVASGRPPGADASGEASARPVDTTAESAVRSSAPPARSSSSGASVLDDTSQVERRSARKTFGPQWITSPPWVKHPYLVWGAVALLAGAGIGVLVTPPSEPAWTSGFPVTAGWTTEGERLVSVDDGSSHGVARAIYAPLAGETGTLSASVVEVARDGGFAGVVVRHGNRVVGVGAHQDGACARVEQGSLSPLAGCRAAPPTALALRCATADDVTRCFARVGDADEVKLVEGRGATMAIGLVCAGPRCVLDDVAMDDGARDDGAGGGRQRHTARSDE